MAVCAHDGTHKNMRAIGIHVTSLLQSYDERDNRPCRRCKNGAELMYFMRNEKHISK